jgi:hypothetical protein
MGVVGAIIVTGVIAFALGAAVGRWLAVAVAGLVWPVFSFGIWIGVWGHGFSKDDSGWAIATMFALYTVAAIAGATLGVLAPMRNRGLRHPLSTN